MKISSCLRVCFAVVCMLNVARFLPETWGSASERAVSFSCSFLGLVLLWVDSCEQKENYPQSDEIHTDFILRRQIQILNWRIMLNKTLTLYVIKKRMRRRAVSPVARINPVDRKQHRNGMHQWNSWSDTSDNHNGLKQWKSWSETSPDLPNFDGVGIRNTD